MLDYAHFYDEYTKRHKKNRPKICPAKSLNTKFSSRPTKTIMRMRAALKPHTPRDYDDIWGGWHERRSPF